MDILESLKNDFIGIVVLLAGIILLALLVKLITKFIDERRLKNDSQSEAEQAPQEEQQSLDIIPYCQGELKLNNVDEKTAALIMAIVSHKTGIKLSELVFSSIRLIN